MRALIAEICSIREKLTGVMNHDWVSVPLVYTQVVTLAVYFYFTAALIGAQVVTADTRSVAESEVCLVDQPREQGGLQDGPRDPSDRGRDQTGPVLPFLPHNPVRFLLRLAEGDP